MYLRRDYAEKFLSKLFYQLGLYIAKQPAICIAVSLVGVCSLSSFAFFELEYLDDPEYLFAPTHSRSHLERQTVATLFPTNTSNNFDVGRAAKQEAFTRVIIEVKNGSILSEDTWEDIMGLDRLIRSMTIAFKDEDYTYDSLCAKDNGRCFSNKFIKPLSKILPLLARGQRRMAYPLEVFGDLYVPTGVIFGGVILSEDGKTLVSAKALSLYYYLEADSTESKYRAQRWEDGFVELLTGMHLSTANLYFFTSRSLAAELERNTLSIAPLLTLTLVTMVVFTMACCCSTESWHETKPWVGLLSCVTVLLSVVAATGTLALLRIPFIGINLATPFLMLGIGLDDTFVMLAAWRHTSSSKPVPQRMAEMLSDAGVAITITSLTNVISFIIGAYSPFPSVFIFCVYTAICAAYTFILQVIFLGAFIALWGRFEAEKLHGLLCYKIPFASDLETSNIDAFGTKRDERKFFRDVYAKAVASPPVKCMILILFVLYLAGAVYGCSQLREGLDRARLTLDVSYAKDFFQADDKYFKSFPYRVQVVFNRPLEYTSVEVAELINIVDEFEASPFVNNRELSECWFRDGVNATRIKSSFRRLVSKLKQGKMAEYLATPDVSIIRKDVRWANQSIVSSRCMIQARNVRTSNDEKAMMVTLRNIADRHPAFNITVFNPMFVFFDQFLLVRSTTMQSVGVATVVMVVVASILIPSGWAVIWIALSIMSIEAGVIGYMTLWGVNLDSISMINLIMCIGFSVDYSAHIAYAFLSGKATTSGGRLSETLGGLAVPVLQGAVSTFLGIVILAFTPSYIFLTFFKTICLVIVFGALHALVFLPIFLSLTFHE